MRWRADPAGVPVVFHVQAGAQTGMGHLARSAALMNALGAAGLATSLHLEADMQGRAQAQMRGLAPLPTMPATKGPIVIDAVSVTGGQAAALQDFFPRILISPICDRADLASHALLRAVSPALRAQLAPETVLEINPDFAFVTAQGLRRRRLDYDALRVGVCLSGGENPIDLDALLSVISRSPQVAEIRVIDRRIPALVLSDARLRHATPLGTPWAFLDGINLFVGGDGVMLAEAIAQGLPALSLTTPERNRKNAALLKSGALRAILRCTSDAQEWPELAQILGNTDAIEGMHHAAFRLDGPTRSGTLARQIVTILKDSNA